MKEGFIYIWYDRKYKKYYLGRHFGKENDGYICSSDCMRAAHHRRPQDFKRRIIQKNILREDLPEEEFKWLSLIKDEELGVKYYNKRNDRFHGHTESGLKKIRDSSKERWKNGTFSEASIDKMRKARLGKKSSEETRRKISKSNKGKVRSDDTKKKISKTLSGRTITEKQRMALLNFATSKKSEEHIRKLHEGRNRYFKEKNKCKKT